VYDAIIIGGGFYGSAIAIHLATRRGFKRLALLERGAALMTRASYNNQARVHNGYHYPRSFTTAFRSRINLPRFVEDFPFAVKRDFTKLYAIARRGSKVTARQFERFCREIGAKLEPAPIALRNLFEPRLIEEVFLVEEYAFDASKLAQWTSEHLAKAGVEVHFDATVLDIRKAGDDGALDLGVSTGGRHDTLRARYVFNCTYSGVNQFGGDFPRTTMGLKQEITEMALMKVPEPLVNLGVTVMDGPYFSVMPFPARALHTLSHVRYTPHQSWIDAPGIDPYARLAAYPKETRVDRMVRDAARVMPAVHDFTYVESLFEVKSVLIKNEGDDGRPILFERHRALPSCFSVLGGKIDNIYDVLERLDREDLPLA
jgi:glycine/D-amino acid oxidase-like deaminating enzyme